MSVTGKVVLVTGAGSGIGAAIAIDLASKGALLSITDFRENDLKKTAILCKGVKPHVIVKDFKKDEDIEYVVFQTVGKYGYLDVIINNFGIDGCDWIETLPRGETRLFDSMFFTNISNVCKMTILNVPFLKRSRGCIINVTCVCNVAPTNDGCRVKNEVDRLTLRMAAEHEEDQIRVNAVFLNRIPTGYLRSIGFSETYIESIFEASEKQRKEAMQKLTEKVCLYIIMEDLTRYRDTISEEAGNQILHGAPGH